MLDWDREKDKICANIEKTPAVLKIVLKTKDDPFFLQQWIEHHVGIVGSANIIIFDNQSTDPDVADTFGRFSGDIEPISFKGNHNLIHTAAYFPELYEALRRSSKFLTFLDTDERLALFDNDHFYSDD